MKKACFCGKVTMEFPEKPLLHFMCHCTDCDSLWNGAYMGFVYPTAEVTIGGENLLINFMAAVVWVLSLISVRRVELR